MRSDCGNVFIVSDENKEVRMLQFEPHNRRTLRKTNEILQQLMKNLMGAAHLKSLHFKADSIIGQNYLLTSAYSLQINEVFKLANRAFTPGCCLNVASQSLEVSDPTNPPSRFHSSKDHSRLIQYGRHETKIMLTDFRLARSHFEPESNMKKVRAARPQVKYAGTSRYASIAAMREQEQGRKDDLESWMYMVYELFDPVEALSWQNSPRDSTMIKEQENFHAHLLPKTYKKVPVQFKYLVDMIHSLKYETFKEVIESYGKSMNLDMMACDWEGSLNMEIVYSISMNKDKSVGNEFSGMETGSNDSDYEKNTSSSRKMNVNDALKNGKFTWKVVDHRGSGGFGDVYKVYDENSSSKMYYALKVESKEEKKTMLRLKVKMQILMSIQEDRKNPLKIGKSVKRDSNSHFVEYVDCGKNTDIRCKFIVMSLVGPSLDDFRKKRGIKLDEWVTPFNIALQSSESVQDLHHLGNLHRDIKPANFAVGFGPAEAMIFMLDFGIGRSFLDSSKEHRAPRKSVEFLGTLCYASRACMKGIDQGRRDDLECWLHMIPCQYLLFASVKERDEQDGSPDVPAGWRMIIEYVDSLTFTCAPNYEKMMRDVERCAGAEGWNVKEIGNEGIWVGHLDDTLKQSTFEDSKSASSGAE